MIGLHAYLVWRWRVAHSKWTPAGVAYLAKLGHTPWTWGFQDDIDFVEAKRQEPRVDASGYFEMDMQPPWAKKTIGEAEIRADEREKQRLLIDQLWEKVTATHARLDALEARRKREQVMEEALRKLEEYGKPCAPTPCAAVVADMLDVVRRALEWKPPAS